MLILSQVTPLTTALEDLSLLHLVIPYTALTKQLIPLTRTLPLTLHNLQPTQQLFHAFFQAITSAATTEASGLDGVLILYSKWFETVSEEGVGCLVDGAEDLLRIGGLSGLQAVLIEKTYSTLSAIFKTMAPALVQQKTPQRKQILQNLWGRCTPYLSASVKPHVRSCVAQAWAVILRRARGDVARDLIQIMVDHMVDVGVRGIASTLSESMKGATHLLHSRATQLYSLLLQHLLSTSDIGPASPLLSCMVLLTTSLIHYTSATAMAPIHNLVITALKSPITEQASASTLTLAQSTAVLRLASTLVGVRKGMRLPPAAAGSGQPSALQQYMHALVAWLPIIESSDRTWRIEYLRALTACLVGGKLGDWLSPGVKLIDGVWESLPLDEKFAWTSALVRIKWKGVEQFVLHHVARTSVTSLKDHRLETISLLAVLAKGGFLDAGLGNVQGGRWKELLSRSVAELFEQWSLSSTPVNQPETLKCISRTFRLCSTLAASAQKTFLSPMRDLLIRLRKSATAMSEAEAREAFAAGPFTIGHVLGSGLACLGEMTSAGVDGVDAVVKEVVEGAQELLSVWGWHRQVLQGLATTRVHWVDTKRCVTCRQGKVPKTDRPPRSIEVTHKLQNTLSSLLMSQDSLIRTSALEILSQAKTYTIPKAEGADVSAAELDLYELCLHVEEAGMTLQNVREKTTKIRKIEIALRGLDLAGADELPLLNNMIGYLLSMYLSI